MARPRDIDAGFVAGPLLGKDEIRRCLGDLAEELERRGAPTVELIIVGGTYLALHDLRESTRDVDSATALNQLLRDAAVVVAERRGLRQDWINDHARPFLPADFERSLCSVLVEYSTLTVLGPPPDDVLMMKAYASRETDVADMVRLWPLCSFTTPAAAARRFVHAYPHAPDDPHLDSYFAGIASRAKH